MAQARIKVTLDKTMKTVAALRALAGRKVYVGVPSEKALRYTAEDRAKAAPINNAAIGYLHEHGVPILNIPARPFLKPGVREGRNEYLPYLKQAMLAAFEGNEGRVIRALNAAGLKAQAAVRKKITTGPFVPLSPKTIAARRARGVTRIKPLIDTGQLRQAINYVVRSR